MAEKKVNEATWALVKSFQETNQAVVQSIMAAQERNTKFAQSFFSEGMEILKSSQAVSENAAKIQERNMKFVQSFFTEGVETLKSQAESARALVEELQQKTQEQQEAFQRLTQESMEAYMDHQSLLTCPIWKLTACCRAVVDSYRIFSSYRNYAGLLRVRELPIDHTAIHGWVQRKELSLWQIQ